MKEDKTIIELERADTAFILRGDGSPELYLEDQGEDEEISEAGYLMAGLSVAFVHHREELRAFVDHIFDRQAAADDPDRSPEQ